MNGILGVEPPAPAHGACTPPLASSLVQDWTVWRCPCGKAYRLEPYDPGHDVQEGDGPARSWRRYERRDA